MKTVAILRTDKATLGDEIKISNFNYKGAQWLAYVEPEDIHHLLGNNYLEELIKV